MLTGYPLSCTLGRSVLGIGSGVARFLMTAEYATYRYLRCVVNVILGEERNGDCMLVIA